MSVNDSHVYEIRVEGLMSAHWSDWFDGLAIQRSSADETVLRGRLADQAALFGVLDKIHSLNLPLVAVIRLPPDGVSGTS